MNYQDQNQAAMGMQLAGIAAARELSIDSVKADIQKRLEMLIRECEAFAAVAAKQEARLIERARLQNALKAIDAPVAAPAQDRDR
jgi:hypothetical protein